MSDQQLLSMALAAHERTKVELERTKAELEQLKLVLRDAVEEGGLKLTLEPTLRDLVLACGYLQALGGGRNGLRYVQNAKARLLTALPAPVLTHEERDVLSGEHVRGLHLRGDGVPCSYLPSVGTCRKCGWKAPGNAPATLNRE